MSRVAEALKRHRLAAGASAPEAAPPAEPSSSYSTELPWELDEIVAPMTAADLPPESARLERPPAGALPLPAERLEIDHGSQAQLTRLVHAMLQATAGGTRVRSVLFTTVGSEGSAGVCAATAAALAGQTPGSVCMVEANLRDGAVSSPFGLAGATGVSDLLLGKASFRACLSRVTPNLWLMPAGTSREAATPLISGEQMRLHLREMLGTFDYLLVDTPSAGGYGDALAFAALVDGVVLVIGANATRREVARRITDQLRGANARVLGAVLTNRDFPIPEAIYRLL